MLNDVSLCPYLLTTCTTCVQEECTDLRIKYEQAMAKLETKDMESKRYRDLYESEMQWRMKLSEQVYRSTDKAFSFKNKLVYVLLLLTTHLLRTLPI